MSGHHYFRDFMCCDSGMIPWLLVAEVIERSGHAMANLLSARMAAFPSSGEINFRTDDPAAAIARVAAAFAGQSPLRVDSDGLSLAFADWRLNLRRSNTEPVLRLNLEGRGAATNLPVRLAMVAELIDNKNTG